MKERFTLRESVRELARIRANLERHDGQKALYIIRDGRRRFPYLVTLKESGECMTGRLPLHDKNGRRAGEKVFRISPKELYTGETTLMYFDDGV